ncbi:hypothetical protein [Agrococcus terreus]|uniref:hypothetical protein n=1 Tax=Agrococcus terreus TaxID=574649 RepID=UPI0031D20F81
MDRLDLSVTTASLALRPPRVAILIPEDPEWRQWAAMALRVASGYWGGGGYILVPFDRNTSAPRSEFEGIVRAYDPDHVVVLSLTVGQLEELIPGSVNFGEQLDKAEKQRRLSHVVGITQDPAALEARSRVAEWCSPMRRDLLRRASAGRAREAVTSLAEADEKRRHRPFARRPPAQGRFVAAHERWSSDAGLAVAARCGVALGEDSPRQEPSGDVFEWLLSGGSRPAPAELIARLGQDDAELGAEQTRTWTESDLNLRWVTSQYSRDRVAIVVGDTAADFALALAYGRLLGHSSWLPAAAIDDRGPLRNRIVQSLARLADDLEHQAGFLVITSLSFDDETLSELADSVRTASYRVLIEGMNESDPDEATVQVRNVQVEANSGRYIIEEHLGTSVLLPMTADGPTGSSSVNGLVTPVPSMHLYPGDLSHLPFWYVDASIEGDESPSGRDIPASVLLADGVPAIPEVDIRSSSAGISYDPSSLGWVSGGSLLPGRIGRPRVRRLAMRGWVEGMASAAGLEVRLSLPGRHADLVANRLGSRAALVSLVSGQSLDALSPFVVRTDCLIEPEQRVELFGEYFLTFDAMLQAGKQGADSTVALVDTLSEAGLLRRGIIVNCIECERPSFIEIGKLAQVYSCGRCSASNALSSARWRKGNEPRWFYDLSVAFRELLARNGHVPLLASARLGAEARKYSDCPELEFVSRDTGKPVAEIDLVGNVDDEIVVVEAKTDGSFGSRKRRDAQLGKLMRIATDLRADRIVLATTARRWARADLDRLRQLVSESDRPRVRVEEMNQLR